MEVSDLKVYNINESAFGTNNFFFDKLKLDGPTSDSKWYYRTLLQVAHCLHVYCVKMLSLQLYLSNLYVFQKFYRMSVDGLWFPIFARCVFTTEFQAKKIIFRA